MTDLQQRVPVVGGTPVPIPGAAQQEQASHENKIGGSEQANATPDIKESQKEVVHVESETNIQNNNEYKSQDNEKKVPVNEEPMKKVVLPEICSITGIGCRDHSGDTKHEEENKTKGNPLVDQATTIEDSYSSSSTVHEQQTEKMSSLNPSISPSSTLRSSTEVHSAESGAPQYLGERTEYLDPHYISSASSKAPAHSTEKIHSASSETYNELHDTERVVHTGGDSFSTGASSVEQVHSTENSPVASSGTSHEHNQTEKVESITDLDQRTEKVGQLDGTSHLPSTGSSSVAYVTETTQNSRSSSEKVYVTPTSKENVDLSSSSSAPTEELNIQIEEDDDFDITLPPNVEKEIKEAFVKEVVKVVNSASPNLSGQEEEQSDESEDSSDEENHQISLDVQKEIKDSDESSNESASDSRQKAISFQDRLDENYETIAEVQITETNEFKNNTSNGTETSMTEEEKKLIATNNFYVTSSSQTEESATESSPSLGQRISNYWKTATDYIANAFHL